MAELALTIEEMNALQDTGIISDNCVKWQDVCESDRLRAIAWLQLNDALLI